MFRSFSHIISLFSCVFFFTCFPSVAQSQRFKSSAFIENKGQIMDQDQQLNNDVLFLYTGKGIKIQLRRSGYSYELIGMEDLPVQQPNKNYHDIQELLKTRIRSCRADIDFIEMNPATEIIAEQQCEGLLNYFISGKKISNVPSFSKIIYKNIFPQTDIEFILDETLSAAFKYNIILRPGADVAKVKFLVKGASLLKTETGDIAISTSTGTVTESIPASFYMDAPGQKETVDFNVKDNTVSFSADYDKNRTFIIDPSSNRIWGTYFGGNTLDYCTAADVDDQDNVYITGYTLSTTNIATSGTYQPVLNGSFDIYLAKFNSAGTLLWGTYFGGSSVEAAYGMYIASGGAVYLCGDTFSTSGVATAGAHQTIYGGGVDDALLVKFDAAGQLLWSTYYGGSLHDIASGVVEDSNGNVIISGHSESSNAISTAGAFNNSYSGAFDVFIAKFDSLGVRQWGTYYGEIDTEEAFAIDCDASDNIYVTGFTTSSNNIATSSGHQTSYSGLQDAFIAKFDPAGTALLYGSYYGGPGNDQGTAIKIGNAGTIFLTGNTTSFVNVSTAGSYQPAIGSAEDGFIVRFNAAGVRQWGTYFGGNEVDYIADLILDSNENILFCGSTLSTNVISTTAAYQTSLAEINYYDSYFERFDTNGNRKLGTYFGGSSNDHGRGIAIDNYGKIYMAGETSSTDSIASPGAFNTIWAGGDEAFLAKFCVAPEPVIFPAGTTTICEGDTLWLSVQSGFASYLWNDGSSGNQLVTSDTASNGTYYYAVTVADGTGCDATADSVIVIVDVCTSVPVLEDQSVIIFPVPSSGLLYVELKNISEGEKAELAIFSSAGKLITKNTYYQSAWREDIKKLSAGIYLLQVSVKDKMFRKRFIKQ